MTCCPGYVWYTSNPWETCPFNSSTRFHGSHAAATQYYPINSYVYVKILTFSNMSLLYEHFFWRNAERSTREARPDTLIEVRARSAHSGARGKPSTFFFSGGSGLGHFPGFSTRGLILCVCTGKISSAICAVTSTQPIDMF